TQVNYDDAQTARDFDAPSPCRGVTAPAQATVGTSTRCLLPNGSIAGGGPTATLGEYRRAYLNAGVAEPYVQDGSFVKLREVTLSYSVPTSFGRRLLGSRVGDVNLSLTGRNLLTSTKYWG